MLNIIQILSPIFIIIFMGFLYGEKALGTSNTQALNLFVYYFAFPSLVIDGLIDRPLTQIINGPFILGYFMAGLSVFIIAWLLHLKKPMTPRLLVALSASFPNCGYIGIPLITALFGVQALLPAIIATVISLCHLLVGIVLLEVQTQKHSDIKTSKKYYRVLVSSLLNPMILCVVIGLMIAGFNCPIPTIVRRVLQLFAQACVPCALFAIGHQLMITKKQATIKWHNFIDIFILKNLVQGLLAWLFFHWLHVNHLWTVIGVIVSALSTGLVLPVIALKYKAYQLQAPRVVFLTTATALFSLSVWVILLQYAYPELIWK